MKKIFRFALGGILIIAGCTNNKNSASNPGGYVINGTISNEDSGWIYLAHRDSTGLVKDSVRINDHKFTFMGKVAEPALYYLLTSNENEGGYLPFFVEDTTIQITANKDSLEKATVSGSHTQDLYESYNKIMLPFKMKELELEKGYKTARQDNNKEMMDSIEKAYDKVDSEQHQTIVSYAQSNPSSIISAWAVAGNMLTDPNVELLKKTLATFTPAVQQSKYGKQIAKTIKIAENLAIGNTAPDFTMNDTAGKPVSLSSFHGKYVLVDFWASWCGPCRRENPNVVAAYQKYKGKNFAILGVSLDEQRVPWIKAINDDHLTWTEVSDLKYWKNAVAVQYGIRSIPSNYLLDPDGKIIGHDLRGDELEAALAKALH